MNQTHSRSRTDLDQNYQGGLRSSQKAKPSLFWKIFSGLRTIFVWAMIAILGILFYQERVWSNTLEAQSDGYMTLISNLVKDSKDLKVKQKRDLLGVLRNQKIRRCFFFLPIITIPCVESLSSP